MAISPFSESSQFEQGNLSDGFYASGSAGSIGEDPGTFSKALQDKSQIRLSFTVSTTVQMPANTSSIYYYNPSQKKWNLPTQSLGDYHGPFDKFSFPTQWNGSTASGSVSPGYTNGSLFTEDAKGFSPYGNPIVSGSNSIYSQTTATNVFSHTNGNLNDMFASSFDTQKIKNKYIELETADYTKSVQRSDLYVPSENEVFTIPIDQPFLIEKAVVEIPFCFGSSWFNDRTVTTNADFSGSKYNDKFITGLINRRFFDRGGPALTLGIFCKKKFGKSYVLDLITTGTITHTDDQGLSVDVRDTPPNLVPYAGGYSGILCVTSTGVETPAVSVSKNIGSTFTGSVVVKLTSSNSNGLQVIFSQTGNWSSKTTTQTKAYFADLFSSQTNIDEPSISNTYFIPSDVDPFGRGMTGFSPSGGSIFGGEYATGKRSVFDTRQIKNYFYISDSTKRQAAITKINALIDSYNTTYAQPPYIIRTTNFGFSSSTNSPYLIKPGEQLVLAITKSRPAVTGSAFNIANSTDANTGRGALLSYAPFTGSLSGHDVQLATGSINITFYGSYVKQGNSYIP